MPYAVDLFCGAGGFSEGIIQSGFNIIFSSDRSPMVQETYMHRHEQLGLVQDIDTHFELADVRDLTSERIFETINKLKYGDVFKKGNIDAIFGGPPCQGFSRLGKRDANDPRNMLFHEYIRIIKDLMPKYVVMENVTGLLDMRMLDFPSVLSGGLYAGQILIKDILRDELEGLGYTVLDLKVLNAADFGVPQQRNRVVFLAYRKDVYPLKYPEPTNDYVNVYDALGDLYDEPKFKYSTSFSSNSKRGRTQIAIKKSNLFRSSKLTNMEISKHDETVIERFSLYNQGENRRKVVNRLKRTGINLKDKYTNLFYDSLFQLNSESNKKIIRDAVVELGINTIEPNDKWTYYTNHQLALLFQAEMKNNDKVFGLVIKSLARRLNTDINNTLIFWDNIKGKINQFISSSEFNSALIHGDISDEMSDAIFTKKGIRTRLDTMTVAPTMVTLPDDFIHPFFNRILTVREMARIQSFDDSFEFLGKRTTGGSKRSQETPQFTQVGNAVPPLLAKAIATEVFNACELEGKI